MRVVIPTRAQMRRIRKEIDVDSLEHYKGQKYNLRTLQDHPYYVLEIDPEDERFAYFKEKGYI